ncbi:MAG: tRNA epoxyqueuosine(34) reductase QueG [Gammaproteobacteria bacterium]|nr:tRNA epoxyqueuosine(34) reductase QueG [Gammaproteobacteria bacterium]MCW5583473.1 tRNA epoxyqueuosine(34) reductase QueG [Gammaproteobacteria bacterium]
MSELIKNIKQWGQELGFQQIGITDTDLSHYAPRFREWLAQKLHGTMEYMEKQEVKRSNPADLVPSTIRIISARMDYLPPDTSIATVLQNSTKGYISRYALGRDYHRLIRKRLDRLAKRINAATGKLGYRAFCDSAPVLEKPIAEKAGLGWIGKHTNLINAKAGSWFFLGEIYTNMPLLVDRPIDKSHCGSCTACIKICPTQAIIAPYQLDARRCISYLTIELRSAIPLELRPLMGNRIYGCDDCQLICPWNKFAKYTQEKDFHPRHHLSSPDLLELFAWTENDFLQKTEGSAIRRIGYACWLRNIAVALGNAPRSELIIHALQARLRHPSALVREHVTWALEQQQKARHTHGS